jgi:small subunit ribosomal protein S27Ae
LVLRLRGGAKKRKKKNYVRLRFRVSTYPSALTNHFFFSSCVPQTTPKKIKHKRKKVKMAILKYYKVDSEGGIKRLRRECPQPTCGAGVFMGWHKDRQSCGKCG